jgi:hypothetical protein
LRRGGRLLEGHADKTLRGEIINLVGFDLSDGADVRTEIGKIVLYERKIFVPVHVQLLQAPEIMRT